jgi:hypothetical protein
MGSSLSVASASLLFSAWQLRPTAYQNIQDEEVEFVEERCIHLNNPLQFFGGRHSYLVATTKSGREVRYDYTSDSPLAEVTYNYYELGVSEVFRRAPVLAGTKVKDVDRALRHNSLKEEYHITLHNCQTVVRDTYNALTGLNEVTTRNDYLLGFARETSPMMRDFMEEFEQVDSFLERKLLPRLTKETTLSAAEFRSLRQRIDLVDLAEQMRGVDEAFEEVQREDADYREALKEMEGLLMRRLRPQ